MPKGSRRHLKRLAAPGHWPIKRKERTFTVRSSPGPHRLEESLPLAIIIRDILKLTNNYNETRRVIARGAVRVDGRVRRNYKHPVGLMDVIEIPDVDLRFRVLPSPSHLLMLHPIPPEEASVKLCKIVGKTTVNNGHIQLHLHDGRNIINPIDDPKRPPKEGYRCGDSLLISLPGQAVLAHIPLKENITAMITGGIHNGFVGKLIKIDTETHQGTLQGADGTTFQTAIRYVFPIGEDKPLISLPEA